MVHAFYEASMLLDAQRQFHMPGRIQSAPVVKERPRVMPCDEGIVRVGRAGCSALVIRHS